MRTHNRRLERLDGTDRRGNRLHDWLRHDFADPDALSHLLEPIKAPLGECKAEGLAQHLGLHVGIDQLAHRADFSRPADVAAQLRPEPLHHFHCFADRCRRYRPRCRHTRNRQLRFARPPSCEHGLCRLRRWRFLLRGDSGEALSFSWRQHVAPGECDARHLPGVELVATSLP